MKAGLRVLEYYGLDNLFLICFSIIGTKREKKTIKLFRLRIRYGLNGMSGIDFGTFGKI